MNETLSDLVEHIEKLVVRETGCSTDLQEDATVTYMDPRGYGGMELSRSTWSY